MKLLFLDVDGVLNKHRFNRAAQSCDICRDCIGQLNRVLRRTDARIVLSSAWRYMIHGQAMTLSGFGYMLRTHGLIHAHGVERIIDTTCPDELCHDCASVNQHGKGKWNGRGFSCGKCGVIQNRGAQIRLWLEQHRKRKPKVDRYVVVDDLDLGITDAGHPFVQTLAKVGLSRRKADQVIELLA